MKVQVKVYKHLSPLDDFSTVDPKNLDYSSVLSTLFCFALIGQCRARRTRYVILCTWLSSRAFHIVWWTVVAKNRLIGERLFHMR